MYDQKIKTMLDEAEDYMQIAREELFKPEEDVVHYMVCQNSLKAIKSYLAGYLLNHNIELNPNNSIEELLIECRNTDTKFDNLKLEFLFNAYEKQDVWMNPEIAKKFIGLAEQTKSIVS